MNIEKNVFEIFLVFVSKIILTILLLLISIYFWPFTLAVVTAVIIEPLVRKIINKTKIKRKFIGTIVVIFIYIILISIISLLVYRLILELSSLSSRLPEIYDKATYHLDKFNFFISSLINKLPVEVQQKIYGIGKEIFEKVTKLVYVFVNQGLNVIKLFPKIIVYAIINFLATIFLVNDRDKITEFLEKKLPSKYSNKITLFVKNIAETFITFLKAQCILGVITFFELFIAFILIKQPYPIVLALVIALVDALPILGTGTVLIPWSICLSFSGKINLSLFLIGTYIIVLVVRQLIEPKIVSKAIGIHPLVTLLCMYICFKMFGLIGLFIGSILAVILKNILV